MLNQFKTYSSKCGKYSPLLEMSSICFFMNRGALVAFEICIFIYVYIYILLIDFLRSIDGDKILIKLTKVSVFTFHFNFYISPVIWYCLRGKVERILRFFFPPRKFFLLCPTAHWMLALHPLPVRSWELWACVGLARLSSGHTWYCQLTQCFSTW